MNLGRLPVIVGLMGLPQGSWQRESVATAFMTSALAPQPAPAAETWREALKRTP